MKTGKKKAAKKPVKKLSKKKLSKIAQFRKNVKILEKRVDEGIAFLDKKQGRDTWLSKINLKILDLSDSKVCICGQVFGGFWNALAQGDVTGAEQASDLGFYLYGEDVYKGMTYDLLTSVWHLKLTGLKLIS